MSLSCRLGFHDWLHIGETSFLRGTSLDRCQRCGTFRERSLSGATQRTYPAETPVTHTPAGLLVIGQQVDERGQ